MIQSQLERKDSHKEACLDFPCLTIDYKAKIAVKVGWMKQKLKVLRMPQKPTAVQESSTDGALLTDEGSESEKFS